MQVMEHMVMSLSHRDPEAPLEDMMEKSQQRDKMLRNEGRIPSQQD